ncbi:MAG: hypothetical protein IKF53_06490 [Clostridia bacterium]|nr:hypothetical protein [Clostridia bacterium]
MEKLLAIIFVLLITVLSLAGCGNKQSGTKPSAKESVETSAQDIDLDLTELKQGDDVSIVGQVAGSTLENGDTLWVQVKQSDESFVIYHCQLKQEFIEKAEKLELGSIVKVKGSFLSFAEFEQENTADLAKLYDCELFK